MTRIPAWFVLAAAWAAVAQPASGPAPDPASQPGAAQITPQPLTRRELLACVELEAGFEARQAALADAVTRLDEEGSALDAQARSLEASRKAPKGSDQAAEQALSARIEAYKARVAAHNAGAEGLRAEQAGLREDAEGYNATCARRPYDPRDKQLAQADYRERKAAAAAAGPFEAGVKAFDQHRYEEALAAWLPLAEQGRAAAQFNVAVMYEQGLGVAKSDAEAARWFLRAAERGDVTSQLKMGDLYEAGVGVSRDIGSASFWYGEAAKGTGRDANAARQARERLARLPKEYQAGAEDIVAFEGGRFVVRRAASKECIVALQGTVTQAANLKFDEVLRMAKAQGCAQPLTLLLESPGGIHEAGLALARSVRGEGMHTVARYDCASSCATIFLGGVQRVLWGARAAIGFHQLARLSDGGRVEDGACVASRDDPGVAGLRRYLRFAVPETADEIFGIVMSTPCKSIEWVKGQRALDLQVATRVEAEADDVFGPRERRVNASATVAR